MKYHNPENERLYLLWQAYSTTTNPCDELRRRWEAFLIGQLAASASSDPDPDSEPGGVVSLGELLQELGYPSDEDTIAQVGDYINEDENLVDKAASVAKLGDSQLEFYESDDIERLIHEFFSE
jgi:hypothetical protein